MQRRVARPQSSGRKAEAKPQRTSDMSSPCDKGVTDTRLSLRLNAILSGRFFYRRRRFRALTALMLCWVLTPSALLPSNLHLVAFYPVFPKSATGALQIPRRPDEILIRFRSLTSEQQRDEIAFSHGARRRVPLRGASGFEKLKIGTTTDVESTVLQLMLDPSVEFAEPNFLISHDQLGTAPNDPRFNEEWSLRNLGQNGGQYGSDINVSGVWQTTTGGAKTVVAIVDSGIDFTHPDLAENQWINDNPLNGDLHGWDFVEDSGVIKDEQGHGTAVAGIVAATGNNGVGISGVMWNASLMSLRVLDETGTGDVAAAVEAIDYAVMHGAQVINLSWGTSGNSFALKEAINRAIRSEAAVVCSAGNGGQDIDTVPYYPASSGVKDLVAVSASDQFDQLTSWSNWGRKSVTIAAPGVNILTTQKGGGYWSVTGTSAAAPLVTGVMGLLKSAKPWLSAHALTKTIENGARHVVSLEGKIASNGVLSAQDAFDSLQPYGNGNGIIGGSSPRGGTAHGPGGTFVGPPPSSPTAPGPNLPNLDELRNSRPSQPTAHPPIQSNLMCADCDPQSGGGGSGYYPTGDPNFSTARMRPANETGEPGEDLGSQNFNWSLPLLNLPGRSGLDVSLTLYYNSLVWTKDGSFIKFNADLGSPAPGFKLGLPSLQQRFTDAQTGGNAFIMVLPSGGRIEMRQVGTSNVYESQDSTYTQLTDNGGSGALVKTTDGTQFSFTPVTVNSEYRCTQIKDRNGNFISATYNTTNGHLLDITDTLHRVISFSYDGNSNLQAIRQSWASGSHDWATFYYGEVFVSPAFGGSPTLMVNGPNGSNVTVLTQVNLDDGSYITFDYNAAFGQVKRINHYAPDNHLLSYSSYNVSSGTGQTECPRFTERRDWAQDWNGDSDGVPTALEEAVTTFTVDGNGAWTKVKFPDGTVYKEIYETSGWRKGLVNTTKNYATEAEANAQPDLPKKWTTITWTQDSESLTYQKNPRVSETNIYDVEGNRKRVTIDYLDGYSLPTHIREYGGSNGQTFLRLSVTNHKLDADYINRRLIGLPYEHLIYDGPTGNVMSRLIFHYDWGNQYFATQMPSTNYDSTNYPSSFIMGRGNLVGVQRYDCTNNTTAYDGNLARWVQLNGYNMAGSRTWTEDGSWHHTAFNYSDAFSVSSNNSLNTLAYVTTVTDPGGFSSTSQHNYDFGGITRLQTPTPAGQSQGLIQTWTYFDTRRIDRVTVTNNGAYTRFVYLPSFTEIQSFSTNNNTTEQYSVTLLDGAGRARGNGADLPNSTGGYVGSYTGYDVMGRANKVFNPTEMDSYWIPSGDDTSAGWIWTEQTYDWKGRPLVTTNPDGWTRENAYGGCGCAGGELVTSKDEAGRRRRATSDTLGRLIKLEELNWNQTVYATTNYAYNVRDQITSITQQSDRTRTFNYDGMARLQTKITPEQGTTNYSYFDDDLPLTITDARGARTTFTYNSRHLVTNVAYDVLQAPGVVSTPNVSYGYDDAGNRTSMTDGLGSTTYSYDQLSRMTSETRNFTSVGSYTLTYDGYNLSGQLTSFSNPWGAQVGYAYDKAGRLTNVSGANYGGVSTYASSLTYRAFGGIKGMNYGNARSLSVSYDNRLRPTQWNWGTTQNYKYFYDYLNEHTGRVTYTQNMNDGTLDRSYEYDHVGRLSFAHSGAEARAHAYSGQWGTMDGPFSLAFEYDEWGNMTHRYGWGGEVQGGGAGQSSDLYYSYNSNNRRTGFSYDNAGNLTNDLGQTFAYDATRQQTSASYGGYSLQQSYDGDGLRVKKTENGDTTYYLRSTVLGGSVVAEIKDWGSGWSWWRGYVYSGSQLLAIQKDGVNWVHEDPITKSKRITNSSGAIVSTIELDPWGADTSRSSNAAFQPRKFTTYDRDANGSDDAMFRRYNRWHSRFDQPDPYDGSYNLTNPQSLNRYSYTQNDPVNFVDPFGLDAFDELGDPPAIPKLIEYGGTIVTNTSAPRWDGGAVGGIFGDTGILIELPGEGGGGLGGALGGDNPQKPTDTSEAERLLTENCVHLLNSILAELGKFGDPYSFNFWGIFRKAKDGQKFHTVHLTLEQQNKYGMGGTHSVVGDPAFYVDLDAGLFNRNDLTAGYVMIHELFHGSGASNQYDHFQMATAAYNVALSNPALMQRLKNYSTPGPPRPVDYSSHERYSRTDDNYNAGIFDAVVRIGCSIPG